jgi:RNA polymerase sigma-70 factor, ECF subfamily
LNRADDVSDVDDVTVFEAERARLLGLAYRMLGSRSDAEDIVQDAWLRWQGHGDDRALIDRPAAWLTTVVSRLALDRLRARQRDRADYVGPWLPEPVLLADDPSVTVERRDSLRLGFVHLLERLNPRERVAFVLADVFDEPHQSISTVLDESVVNCRQLVSRARRKLAATPAIDAASTSAAATAHASSMPPLGSSSADALDAFLAAAAGGDVDALLAALSPEVVLVSDGGADRHAARRPVLGADRVARFLLTTAQRAPTDSSYDVVVINSERALLVSSNGRPFLALWVQNGTGGIDAIRIVVNPTKLAALATPVAMS